MKAFRWAVIGAGGLADRRTVPAILKDPGSALAAVSDRSRESAKRVGEKYGVPYFTTLSDMAKGADFDAVYIATPLAFHYEAAVEAIRMSKHVLVEKPVTLLPHEGEELLGSARAAGLHFSVGYMMKYHGLHEKAKQLIGSGGIGTPVSVSARFSCWYPPIAGAWRQSRAVSGGGALMDLGVHCLELIAFLLDSGISDIKCLCSNKVFDYEVEDGAALCFITKSGVPGTINVNFNVPDDACESRLEVYGDKGGLILSGTLGQEEKGELSHIFAPQVAYSAMQERNKPVCTVTKADGGDLYFAEIKRFRESALSGSPDYSDAERAIAVQYAVQKAYGNAGR